ncbi:hypothetical protein J4Q44_G00227450 [Coregonus suidteri]|uniref:Uncharacterized protein n=1 Tax=Coregonus suidteri TaxID=861788 RepID=A0AAN8QZQ3_9TELE
MLTVTVRVFVNRHSHSADPSIMAMELWSGFALPASRVRSMAGAGVHLIIRQTTPLNGVRAEVVLRRDQERADPCEVCVNIPRSVASRTDRARRSCDAL